MPLGSKSDPRTLVGKHVRDRVAAPCRERAGRRPRCCLQADGSPLFHLRGRCRGRLPARSRDPAHKSAADRGRRSRALDADGHQARGPGGPPSTRAAPRLAAHAEPTTTPTATHSTSIASESPGPNDQLARRERVARSGEALQALKPQEVRALTLKAQGYSYAEIGEMTGWSYTKINRCMAEGRKRFLQVFADIEQGRRCEELATALSAFADGEGANGSTDAVEFHLRSCATCRAKLAPTGRFPARSSTCCLLDRSSIIRWAEAPHEWIVDRAAAAADKIREASYSILARGGGGGGSEATALATAGGARGAGVRAVAKVLAICGATAAGGATCVATGLVDPGAVGGGQGPDHQKPALERPAEPIESTVSHQEPTEDPPTSSPAASKEAEPDRRRTTAHSD